VSPPHAPGLSHVPASPVTLEILECRTEIQYILFVCYIMIDATQHEAFSKMKRFPPWYSQRYVREDGSLG
jgi:hypothetical protein